MEKTKLTSIYRINESTYVVADNIYDAIDLYQTNNPNFGIGKVDLIDNFAIIKNESTN